MTRIQNYFKDHRSTLWLWWARNLVTLAKAEKMGMGVWRKTPMDFFCVVPLKTCWPFDLSSWFLSTSRCWPLSIFLFNFLLLFESFQPFVKSFRLFVESFHILTFFLLRRLTKLRSKVRKIFSEWKNYKKNYLFLLSKNSDSEKIRKGLEKKKRIVEGHYLQPHRRTQKPSWSIFFLFLIFCLNGSVFL